MVRFWVAKMKWAVALPVTRKPATVLAMIPVGLGGPDFPEGTGMLAAPWRSNRGSRFDWKHGIRLHKMGPMTESASRRQIWAISVLIAAAVLAVYWPALHCGFVNYDDPDYVTGNAAVQHGLTWKAILWAFTTTHAFNWHPMTWLSHIIDCQLYGLQPAGHHLTSLLFHAANSVLLFCLLRRMTGALWRSALVAVLFALHPLRVQSVVWVSERKDVLSAFFWMLTLWAYIRYGEELKTQSPKVKGYYVAALVLFALGLMAKPMVVTLPFVLLLLDYWPLRRGCLVAEKIPFFALSAVSCVVTFVVQNRTGAILTRFPLSVRLANVPVAYARYISKTFWPSNLAPFYPHETCGVWEVLGSVALLGLISGLVLWRMREQPYLAVGWAWFLGMLVPTIGLVQVGAQSMADRYSYLPSIGLGIMMVWTVCELAADRRRLLQTAAFGAVLAALACAAVTRLQIPYWKDTAALFVHCTDVSDQKFLAYYNLGCVTMGNGDYARAIGYFEKSLAAGQDVVPWADHRRAHNNLGVAYLHEGQVSNAVVQFDAALAIMPQYPEAYYNLGRAFLTNHQADVALECLQKAAALAPDVAQINFTLGETLLQQGRTDAAREYLQKALRLRPDFPEAHYKLANALVEEGRAPEAVAHYERALQLRQPFNEAANNLAWLLATTGDKSLRDGARAVELARQAERDSGGKNPMILGTLAAAYAEAGKYPEAVAAAEQARQLALAQTNRVLAATLETQQRQYQAGRPFRQ